MTIDTNHILIVAVVAGILHALAPDHWFPFVTIGKTQGWNSKRLFWITFLAGIGHLLSSVVIALFGMWLGMTVQQVGIFEGVRANITSFLLIGFGLFYLIWGLKYAMWKLLAHSVQNFSLSRWILFLLLVFGPCEPLIPFIFASVVEGWKSVMVISFAFSIATLVTMIVSVYAVYFGFSLVKIRISERFSHVIAGVTIMLAGIVVRILGI
ncbi:MAG: hypothetical protein HY582_01665 [Candidatus Omnitrophica bacterium]|nr:hypothetical protein [Candidatus Omnitrophota bacterium]